MVGRFGMPPDGWLIVATSEKTYCSSLPFFFPFKQLMMRKKDGRTNRKHAGSIKSKRVMYFYKVLLSLV